MQGSRTITLAAGLPSFWLAPAVAQNPTITPTASPRRNW
jgi:hypothetical protein